MKVIKVSDATYNKLKWLADTGNWLVAEDEKPMDISKAIKSLIDSEYNQARPKNYYDSIGG